jgi:hypothetical protein
MKSKNTFFIQGLDHWCFALSSVGKAHPAMDRVDLDEAEKVVEVLS